ncbi:hypothetical protein DL93DRAFT_2102346 [Clavulina sp. PMI_390]|nr:hypothetical protein DL93DRAFT_2102346 [Clavulina sp. PMI_390]
MAHMLDSEVATLFGKDLTVKDDNFRENKTTMNKTREVLLSQPLHAPASDFSAMMRYSAKEWSTGTETAIISQPASRFLCMLFLIGQGLALVESASPSPGAVSSFPIEPSIHVHCHKPEAAQARRGGRVGPRGVPRESDARPVDSSTPIEPFGSGARAHARAYLSIIIDEANLVSLLARACASVKRWSGGGWLLLHGTVRGSGMHPCYFFRNPASIAVALEAQLLCVAEHPAAAHVRDARWRIYAPRHIGSCRDVDYTYITNFVSIQEDSLTKKKRNIEQKLMACGTAQPSQTGQQRAVDRTFFHSGQYLPRYCTDPSNVAKHLKHMASEPLGYGPGLRKAAVPWACIIEASALRDVVVFGHMLGHPRLMYDIRGDKSKGKSGGIRTKGERFSSRAFSEIPKRCEAEEYMMFGNYSLGGG